MSPSTRRLLAAGLVAWLVVVAGCAGNLGQSVSTSGRDAPGGAGGADGGALGSYYVDGERVVIREASMRVEVESFDPAFVEARRIARRHGGFVADWDHDVERGWHGGDLTIRVPAANFSAARDDVAALGALENEVVRARDFTGEYETTAERLADLRRQRDELEALLARANDTDDARAIHDDLVAVREEIRRVEGQRASIERREALSTIHLSLHEPPGKRPPKNYRSAFGFDDAFLDAFYGGLTAVKYVIVLFGYVIPIGFAAVLLGGFGVVWVRLWQHLRRSLDEVFPGAGETVPSDGPGDPGPTGHGGDSAVDPGPSDDDDDGDGTRPEDEG